MVRKFGKKVSLLIDDFQEKKLPENYVSLGLNNKNYFEYVYHFGRSKRLFEKDSEQYKIEVDTIVNYANFKINNQKGLDILNRINSNKDYERYFR
jgi:hypothetical protein